MSKRQSLVLLSFKVPAKFRWFGTTYETKSNEFAPVPKASNLERVTKGSPVSRCRLLWRR